ncbi:tenascin-X isoform X4 [Xenopus laevis]|uniref:Tenascin-X isoform X4 n=1 Tax=Xenopus laevis TaxID=8355 RepID=A0A8J1KWT3_XENLA|nr:tenascin-X isoform X4 [Xenopus laevis]
MHLILFKAKISHIKKIPSYIARCSVVYNICTHCLCCSISDPSPIQNLSVLEVQSSSAILRWSPPLTGASDYHVLVIGSPTLYMDLSSTEAILNDLIPGNYYTVIVTANGSPVEISFSTVPGKIKNLAVVCVTQRTVSLSWQPSEGNSSSYVMRILQFPAFKGNLILESVTIDNLTPGNFYTFYISVVVGESMVEGNDTSISTYTYPGEVVNLTVSNITTSSVFLSWLSPVGNSSSFLIQILQNSTFEMKLATSSAEISDLQPGNLYTFLVSALVGETNIQGNSSEISAYAMPGRIKNLTIVCFTLRTVSLSWQQPEGNYSSYMLRISQFPTFKGVMGLTSVTIDSLTPGNFYTFYVSAAVGEYFAEGDSTNISIYMKPEQVKNLTSYNISSTSLSLKWDPPNGNYSSFLIQLLGNTSFSLTVPSEGNISASLVQMLDNSTSSRIVKSNVVSIEGLTPGNMYTFFITALVGESNLQGDSATIAPYTMPGKIKNLTIVCLTEHTVSLSWQPPEGNFSAYIFRIAQFSSFNGSLNAENVTIDSLIPGNVYTFYISAVGGDSFVEGDSTAISTYTMPGQIKNLTIVCVTEHTVSLSWQPPEGNFSSYIVRIAQFPTFNGSLNVENVTTDNLIPGNFYTFYISAVVDSFVEGNSNAISTYMVPGKIKNLTIVCVTEHTVSLNWQPPDGNFSSYIVRIAQFPTFNGSLNVENVTTDNLIPGNFYTFYISAVVDSFVEGNSNAISTYMLPGRVRNLTIVCATEHTVSLSWQPPEGNFSSYIFRIAQVPSFNGSLNVENLTIDNLTPGNFYTFYISAVVGDSFVEGDSTAISTYMVPSAIEILIIDNVTTNSVSLSWPIPFGNISSYIIQVLGTPSNELIVNTNYFLVDQLIPGNYYTFIVFTIAGDMNGTKTENSTFTVPSVIASLIIDNVTTNSVSLSWSSPIGNISSYIIQLLGIPSNELILDTNSTIVDQLIPGNYYTFTVFAIAGNINGPKTENSTFTVPSVIANLVIDNVTSTSMSLSWASPVGNISSYIIQIQGTPSKELIVNTNFSLVDELTPGNYYTFVVFATAGKMNGTTTENSTFTVPSVIISLVIDNVTTTSVSLTWATPVGNISSYIIQIQGTPSKELIVNTNSSLVDELTSGNYYTFMVFATAGNMNGTKTENSTFIVPSVIASLVIDNVTTTSVSLSWAIPVGNISSYIIQVQGTPSKELIANTNSSLVDELTPGNYYTFVVFATAGNMNGTKTENSTFTVPSVIANLVIDNVTSTSMSLSWASPVGNISSYIIQIQGTPSKELIVNTNFSLVDELTPGNYYTFVVFATAGKMNGTTTENSTFTVPSVIISLVIDNVTTTSVSLTWATPVGNISSYIIQIQGTPSKELIVNTNSSLVDELTPGNYYTFMVFATAGNMNGTKTENSTFIVPSVIASLVIDNVTTTSVSLSWAIPVGYISSYIIQVQGTPSKELIANTNSSLVDELTPGNYYTFVVFATAGKMNGTKTEISTFIVPSVIANLVIDNVTTTSVSLSWATPVGNISSYIIQVQGTPSKELIVNTNSSFVDELTPGNYYTFVVFATAGNINGTTTENSTFTVPSVITSLIIDNVTTTSMSLSWAIPLGNISSYIIQVQGTPSKELIVNTNSSLVDELTPGNYYTFVVFATAGNMNGTKTKISTFIVPSVIASLVIDNVTTTSVSLSWATPVGNISSYIIQVQGTPSKELIVNTNSSFVDELTPGNYYTFVVFATAGKMNGTKTEISTFIVPSVIASLVIDNVTTTSVSLSWAIPVGNISSYIIQVQGTPSKELIVNTNSSLVDELTPGNYYTFVVFATAGNMNGTETVISTFIVPSVIASLVIDNVTTTSVSLSWATPVGNISSYIIQVQGTPSKELIVNTNSSLVDELTPGNDYTFVVFATAGNMNGTTTENSTFTVPSVITSLIIDNVTTTLMSLRWAIPLGNISSYIIQVQGTPSKELIVNTNSSLVDELTPGNYYTFVVFATAGNMNGTKTKISTFIVPSVIASLVIDNVTTTSVSLSWATPVGNISSYIIQVQGTPSKELIVNTNSSLVDELTPGNYYTFVVFTTAGNMNGTKIENSTFTVPSVITSLIIDNVTTTSVSLSWAIPLGNISSYIIQVQGTPSKELTVNTNYSLVDQLIPGNYYTFTVFDTVGNMNSTKKENSTFTEPASIIVNDVLKLNANVLTVNWQLSQGNYSYYMAEVMINPPQFFNTTSPFLSFYSLPIGELHKIRIFAVAGNGIQGKRRTVLFLLSDTLNYTNVFTDSVALAWMSTDEHNISFVINVTGSPSVSWIGSANQTLIEGLTPGNLYTIQLSAYQGSDMLYGFGSSLLLQTRPGVVNNIEVGNVSTYSVDLSWGPPIGQHNYYSIEVIGYVLQQLNTTLESISVQSLTPGTNYTFRIQAVVGDNLLGDPADISSFTKPGNINILNIDKISNSSLYVSWQLTEGNRTSYLVEVRGDAPQQFYVESESVIITNLTTGNQYTVGISAIAGSQQGNKYEFSVLLSDTLSCTNISTKSIKLLWNALSESNITYTINVIGSPPGNWSNFTNEIVLENLIPGNLYIIQLSAYQGNNVLHGYGGQISVYTRPDEVRNVTFGKETISSIDVSWLPPVGNYSFFKVEISGVQNMTNSTLWTFQELTAATQYKIQIFAVAGEDITGSSVVFLLYTRPDVVRNLSISLLNTTSVFLSWHKPQGGKSDYNIEVLDTDITITSSTESCTITGLNPGSQYTFLVYAVVGNIKGNPVNVSVGTIPSVIGSLIIDNITTNSVSLSWPIPFGSISSYVIQVLGATWKELIVNTNSTTVDELTPGNYYIFVVFATAGNMNGTKTENSTFTVPSVITSLIIDNVTTNSVSLSWAIPLGNISSYIIQVLGTPSKEQIVNTNSSLVDQLIPGNYYTFTVFATAGNMNGSITMNFTFIVPSLITSLTIDNVTTNSVSLSWPIPLGNISSYIIQVLGIPSKELTVNTNSFLVDQLIPGNYYIFVVIATAGNMNGTEILNSTFTVPTVITSLIIDSVTTNSVSLSWSIPLGNISSYIIQVLGTSSKELTVNLNSTIVDQLIPGNYYIFMVFATAGNMNGTKTHNSTFTVPSVIAKLTIDNVTTNSVSLSWPIPFGNISSYIIQILGTPSKELIVNTNSSLVDQLIPGNYYTFMVFAIAGNMNGIKTQNSTFTVPSLITSLIIDIVTTNSVSLSWAIPLGNFSSYTIQVSGTPSKELMVNTNSSLVDQLIPGNYYTFTVFVTAGSMNGTKIQNSIFTVPPVIAGLIIDNVTTNSVSLSWAIPSGNISSYIIQVLGTPSKELIVNTNTSHVDQLIPGNYYTFMVFATNGNINGTKTENSTFTVLPVIASLTIDNVTANSLSLRWPIPLGNISSYIIQVLGTPSVELKVNTNSSLVNWLIPGNYYTFMVYATNGNMNGTKIQNSTFTVLPAIASLIIDNVTTNSVALSWAIPLGNISSYIIQVLVNPLKELTVNTNYSLLDHLIPGNYYTFLVFAVNGNMNGTKTLNSTFTVPPAIPNLTISNVTTNSVSLSWATPLGNVSSYIIQVLGTPSKKLIMNTNFSLVDQLIPGNYYTFMVFATNGNMNGAKTQNSTFTVLPAIASLIIDNVTTTSVSLSWAIPLGNISSYIIQVLGNPLKELVVNTNFSLMENLIPGNYYTFIVFAINGNINGTKTLNSTFTVLPVIASLIVDNITTNSVSLSWAIPLGNISSYIIQVVGIPSKELIVNTNYSLVNHLIPGNYYTFMVFATNGNINSTKTSNSTFMVLPEIASLIIDNITANSVSLSWPIPLGNISSYFIQVLGTPSKELVVNTNSSLVNQLIPGNNYTFVVFATNGNINGTKTSNSTFTVLPVITSLIIYNVTTTSVSLSWPIPSGYGSSYMIQVLGTPMKELMVNANSLIVNQLIPGNYYTFTVSATIENMNGTKTQNSTNTVPSEIGSLSIDNVTTTSVFLRWIIPFGNFSSYIIQVLGTPSKELIVNTNSSNVDQLIPGNYYTFVVFARVGNMNGTKTENYTFIYPSEITSLTIDNITTTSVSLSWPIPLGNISSYIIQVLGTPSKELRVTTKSSFVDQLIPGNKYTFIVIATVGNMNSRKIENSTFTVPGNINIVNINKISNSSLYVSWQLTEGNRTSYLVELRGDRPQQFYVASESVNISNLTTGNQYTVGITAIAGSQQGNKYEFSVLLSDTLSCTNISTKSMKLLWNALSEPNISYTINVIGSPPGNWSYSINEIVLENLIPGNLYIIQLSAYQGNNVLHGYGGQIAVNTIPPVIENLIIDNVTTNSVSLRWPIPLGNISSYIIQVLGTPSKELRVDTNSSLVDQLIPGNYYAFMVFTTNGNINGTKTQNSRFIVPSAIESLNIGSVTNTSVFLSWPIPLGNISSYIIQISGTPSKELIINTNSSLVDQLIPGNYYTFTVFARAGDMNGTKIVNSTFTILPAITSLIIDNVTTNSVSLSWPILLGNISSYIIRVLGTPQKELIVNTNSLLVDQLIPGNFYTFVVFVQSGNKNGTNTQKSTFTFPSAIRSLIIDSVTTNSVSLRWPIPFGNISSYIIQVSGTPSKEPMTVNTNSSLVERLVPGNYYTFTVFATAGNMNGQKTVDSTSTVPSAIESLIIGNLTNTSVSLRWPIPIGNISSYIIQILGTPQKELIVNTNYFLVDQLIPGNFYTFVVFVTNGNMNGTNTQKSTFTFPSAIESLNIGSVTTTSVSLNWPIPLGNISSYIIQVLGTPSKEIMVNTNYSLVEELLPGNNYTFNVFATAGNMNGPKTVNSTATDSSSLFLSMTYSTNNSNIQNKIIQQVQQFLSKTFPGQKITVTLKKMSKM